MTSQCASVLLVDDDRHVRLKLTRDLEARGHAVDVAESGREALKMLAAKSFDLVLLDILMPEMDGLEVLRTLKSDVRLRDIPVIVISGLEDEQSELQCRQLGVWDYLKKPVEANALNVRIVECLGRS